MDIWANDGQADEATGPDRQYVFSIDFFYFDPFLDLAHTEDG